MGKMEVNKQEPIILLAAVCDSNKFCSPIPEISEMINAVGRLAKNDDNAFKLMLQLLKSNSPVYRSLACKWLRECSNPAALENLYEMIKKERNKEVLKMAMDAKNYLEIVLGWSARN